MTVVRFAVAAALTAGAALAVPAAPAVAQPTHVAIEVAFPGGPVMQRCVSWRSGMTGDDVLVAAGFQRHYDQSGLLDQIDGIPTTPDPKQSYWAYFNDPGKGWAYYGQGPTTSQPQPGTVDGWSYDSEQSGGTSQQSPPATSYAIICAGRDPSPTPTAVHPVTSAAPPPSTSQPAVVIPASSSPATRTVTSHTRRSAAIHSHAATPTVSASQQIGTQPQLSPAAARQRPAAHAQAGSSGLPPWETVLGIAAVALLGGLAWWRARARRRA